MNGTTRFRLVQLLYPCHGMLAGHAVAIEPVSGVFAKIREYFNSRTKIFGLLLVWKFEFVTQRPLPNVVSAGLWEATA